MRLDGIESIDEKDVQALSALGHCGYLKEDEIKLSKKRIAQYLRAGLIQRIVHRRTVCFRTTPRGRKFIRKVLSFSPYIPRSLNHDCALAERYFAISEMERKTWQTESQCRNLISARVWALRKQGQPEKARALWDKFRNGELSMPDGAYRSDDGELILIEVKTKNYNDVDIAAKMATATGLSVRLELIDA